MAKKVLIWSLAYYPDYVGGAEVAIKEITDRIPKEEVVFDMITAKMNGRQKRFERLGNVNVYRVGLGISFFDKFTIPVFGTLKALFLNKGNKYDISWCMMANQVSVAASFFKILKSKIPLVLTIQEGDEEEYLKRYVLGNNFLYKLLIRQWHLLVFKKANRATVISEYLRERVESNNFLGPIYKIPNGVDIKNFSHKYSEAELLDLRQQLCFKKEDKAIITTSRLTEKNAVEDIVTSLSYLPKNYRLLILGTGPLLYKLQNLVQKEGVYDRVKFLGHVSHKEIPKYLKISNVFVRPSLSEGMGNSFIEAFTAGVPVVATPVGGIPDFLFDRETGLFCEVKNPKSIADKIKLLDKNVELRDRIIEKAKKLAKEKYDWNLIAKKMLNQAFSGLSANPKRIVIATGIYPPQTGGPAYYAKSLNDIWSEEGNSVSVVSFGHFQKYPWGLRHVFFLLKVVPSVLRTDYILALDAFSAGIFTLVSKIFFSNKVIFRTGGDALWELYVNRTEEAVSLSDFYSASFTKLSLKETIMFRLMKWAFANMKAVIFSTEYQRDVFIKAYDLNPSKIYIVENSYKEKVNDEGLTMEDKTYLWAGRDIPLKNLSRLKEAFKKAKKENTEISLDVVLNPDHESLMEKMKSCYAFVLPSITDISPNLILRAVSFNKPFICTKETGIYGRLKDIGIFVDPLNVEEIKEKILFLADDNNYKEQVRKVEQFSFTHSYKEIAEEILEVAKKDS